MAATLQDFQKHLSELGDSFNELLAATNNGEHGGNLFDAQAGINALTALKDRVDHALVTINNIRGVKNPAPPAAP